MLEPFIWRYGHLHMYYGNIPSGSNIFFVTWRLYYEEVCSSCFSCLMGEAHVNSTKNLIPTSKETHSSPSIYSMNEMKGHNSKMLNLPALRSHTQVMSWTGIAQPIKWLATGWTARAEIFHFTAMYRVTLGSS